MKKPVTAKAVKSSASATASGTAMASQNADESQPAQPADQLLKADHRKVEQLFKKYEGLTDSSEKADCAMEICKELIIHAQLEEEIFYPACRQKGVKSDMLDEAQVEHDGAKVMIRELLDDDPEAEFYDAKVSVLADYIKHHVGEEEKGSEGIFALAKAAGVDMSALGSEMQARKTELMQEMEDEEPLPPEFRSLHAMEGRKLSRQEKAMPRYESEGRGYSSRGGRSYGGRERDEYGRFLSEDDDDRGYARSRSRGRYEEEDDDRGYRSRGRERDEYGRFVGDEDRGYARGPRSRYEDDDERRSYGSRGRERDDYGRFTGDDDDYRRSRGSYARGRSRYEEDEDYSEDRGQGGWFGDPEGHAEAARRGWESRGGGGRGRAYGAGRGRSRYEEDDEGRSHGRSGWLGDPRGHAEAARRGWRNRD